MKKNQTNKLRYVCIRVVVLMMFLTSFYPGVFSEPLSGQPSWDLPLVGGGGRLSLASLRGSVVAASFGATWCPPCRTELPALQALADKYQGKNVKVVWITVDDKNVSDQQLMEFAQKLGLRVPVARDLNQEAVGQFGQSGLPMMVVIDKQGNVVGRPHQGFSDKQKYLDNISSLIESAL